MGTKRKFTPEEKLQILREAEQMGLEQTLRKHQLARSLYYRWKNTFNLQGVDGLQPKYHRVDPSVRNLEKENERLRKVIAKMALELEVKEELLKKTKFR
jgi:transposase-like protein